MGLGEGSGARPAFGQAKNVGQAGATHGSGVSWPSLCWVRTTVPGRGERTEPAVPAAWSRRVVESLGAGEAGWERGHWSVQRHGEGRTGHQKAQPGGRPEAAAGAGGSRGAGARPRWELGMGDVRGAEFRC